MERTPITVCPAVVSGVLYNYKLDNLLCSSVVSLPDQLDTTPCSPDDLSHLNACPTAVGHKAPRKASLALTSRGHHRSFNCLGLVQSGG
ncbi:hypothetical protein PoB_001074800 [Plakobranchus ocellatus]|uniref:Uncharacterized protein n=1 Tax=Plakobranchus ocellatus TaxID=259542 RepID=A0AAV3YNV2_9GAST|nr:hypothetical protein PoB_001074800 [Plakobranchus ocellatus]